VDAATDPAEVTDVADFMRRLRLLRVAAGDPSLAVLAKATGLPRSTLHDGLKLGRARLPSLDLLRRVLRAVECPSAELSAWEEAWRRIAAGLVGLEPTAGEPATGMPAPAARVGGDAAPVPRQLPAEPRLFAGRVRDLARLAELSNAGDELAIFVITGAGGAGKTWLALRWSYDNLDRFPDGQLYLDLHGFDPSGQPTPPAEALRHLLGSLGVAPAAIPTQLDAQIGLYRSVIAGKRMLILLDNVRDADQVRPLLPGSAGCTVIVTSRQRLTSLVVSHGARPLALDLLTDHDARQLLALRVGEPRLVAEPAATTTIISRCAGLPLALALVAALAVARPEGTLGALADDLAEQGHRLNPLDIAAETDELRAVFFSSYRALSPAAARLFRLLGVHPGADIGLPAVASLAGVPLDRAAILLAELAAAHLVTEQRPGRYSLHDLLRAYAAERAQLAESAEGRGAAVRRVLDHYLHTAHAASKLLAPHREAIAVGASEPGVTPEPLSDLAHALGWFNREWQVLVAAIGVCEPDVAGVDVRSYIWRLTDALGRFFARQGHWQEWQATAHMALRAAQSANEQRAQANAHTWLAELHAWIGRHDDIRDHLDRAELLYERIEDTAGLAYVHLCRGWVHEPNHAYGEALHHAERALQLYTIAGHEHGQANATNNVGWYHAKLGNYEQAIQYCRLAVAWHERLGSVSWQGRGWEALGWAYQQLGRQECAVGSFRRAIDLFNRLGSHYYEARALRRLGNAHYHAGHHQHARHAWQSAYDILSRLQHPDADYLHGRLAGPAMTALASHPAGARPSGE
jgi:tetratricopeptide (TPR) repeat protein